MSDESKSPTGDDSSARKEPAGKEAAKASKKRRLRTVLIDIGDGFKDTFAFAEGHGAKAEPRNRRPVLPNGLYCISREE